jgi:hypothetical protein
MVWCLFNQWGNCASCYFDASKLKSNILQTRIFFLSIPPHVPYGLHGLTSRLCPKCNPPLRLGRPWGTVTLSRLGGWWYMNMKYQEGALNLSYTKLPRLWSPWESSLSRKNPHGGTGNRTWDFMVSSMKLWPLDHEVSHKLEHLNHDSYQTER